MSAEPMNDGGLVELVLRCAQTILAGQPTVTIHSTGKRPGGFPRGELLSESWSGTKNYAVDPVKVLAWIHKKRLSAPPADAPA